MIEHYIIVKFDSKINYNNYLDSIKTLFNRTLDIKGVESIKIFTSCSDLINRHDIMIRMKVTPEGLKNFDNSDIHKEWKAEYGKYIVNKTIFDREII